MFKVLLMPAANVAPKLRSQRRKAENRSGTEAARILRRLYLGNSYVSAGKTVAASGNIAMCLKNM
ncbi:hypothetical protein [Methylobacterium sp. B4]|uniref:hypothetical protein n=1 Tax=Methylobacterium sp. B4 TaxID=1938755 RepID=UPI0011B5AC54|nr:hypothetical protein [Methylobacterium sp. B4]